jgi:protein-S-isoprenylcysteine O-methyltransferase Ste14
MSFFGIGPKIGIILIPWLVVTITISLLTGIFSYTSGEKTYLVLSGAILLVVGLIFYFSSVRLLLNGLKSGKLVTNGTFSLCQNPLYVSFIFFLIPAISLLINSWLVLITCIAGYIPLKMFIKNEYRELEKYFGDEYLKYRAETPEFFPFPVKKWFGKKR